LSNFDSSSFGGSPFWWHKTYDPTLSSDLFLGRCVMTHGSKMILNPLTSTVSLRKTTVSGWVQDHTLHKIR
jgi:hypothetical protein